jgi:hypothetical protein
MQKLALSSWNLLKFDDIAPFAFNLDGYGNAA